MSARDREQYAKRREAVLARKRALYRERHGYRFDTCGQCRGKSYRYWCRPCRQRLCIRRGEGGPDYVELATREIEQRVGRPYKQFTRRDHWLVTALLVEWAQSRGQLLDYSRTEMPKGAHRRHRGDAA